MTDERPTMEELAESIAAKVTAAPTWSDVTGAPSEMTVALDNMKHALWAGTPLRWIIRFAAAARRAA